MNDNRNPNLRNTRPQSGKPGQGQPRPAPQRPAGSGVLIQLMVVRRTLWTQQARLLLEVSMVIAGLGLPCWLCHFPGRSCFPSEHVRFLIHEKEIR